ncbi:hypothetical protein B0O99DRAFT_624057 [Bisporella sp. PMI_857]|nr:hypothetical protein B0O99DRAFT_624057 [Bisporella sp. PMI_857]
MNGAMADDRSSIKLQTFLRHYYTHTSAPAFSKLHPRHLHLHLGTVTLCGELLRSLTSKVWNSHVLPISHHQVCRQPCSQGSNSKYSESTYRYGNPQGAFIGGAIFSFSNKMRMNDKRRPELRSSDMIYQPAFPRCHIAPHSPLRLCLASQSCSG